LPFRELPILVVEAVEHLAADLHMFFILVLVVPVSSLSHTHHNKYLKNHNGF
jgi:hypothetical protein